MKTIPRNLFLIFALAMAWSACGDGEVPSSNGPLDAADPPAKVDAPAPDPLRAGDSGDLGPLIVSLEGGADPEELPMPPLPEEKRQDYSAGTLERFARLLSGSAWKATVPPRNYKGMLTATHVKTGLEFVLVPAGTFRMGSDEVENEQPVHDVSVPAFLISTTECTQRAWDLVGGEDGRKFTGPELPIDGVSWMDCDTWCRKAGLRLPSESEWEYACRAGSATKWCCGEIEYSLVRYAWFVENSRTQVHPVGGKFPNAFGLLDVHGNLWEWCADHRHDSYDGAPTDGSAWLTDDDAAFRVKRGGSWNETPWRCRSAMRIFLGRDFRYFIIGFRPAASLP